MVTFTMKVVLTPRVANHLVGVDWAGLKGGVSGMVTVAVVFLNARVPIRNDDTEVKSVGTCKYAAAHPPCFVTESYG
ncbi:MAG: hypothetical protein L3J97_02320 [Thermoplasmata archaeon]|nr:hypothetical protein [Thermoplasmata archaeon]